MELYEGQALADEVIAYLHEHDFRLQGIYNMAYDPKGRAIQGDFSVPAKSITSRMAPGTRRCYGKRKIR
jgi:hypothetical protein